MTTAAAEVAIAARRKSRAPRVSACASASTTTAVKRKKSKQTSGANQCDPKTRANRKASTAAAAPAPTRSAFQPEIRRTATLASLPAKRSVRSSPGRRSEEHTSELQSRPHLVCRLLLEKKKRTANPHPPIRKRTQKACLT